MTQRSSGESEPADAAKDTTTQTAPWGAEQPSSSSIPWGRVMSVAANVVAPATAISALLLYFGYVSTRAQYLYFGLDVDTIGLSTLGYVMRSPQPLLVPVLTLTLLVGGSSWSPAGSGPGWWRWLSVERGSGPCSSS